MPNKFSDTKAKEIIAKIVRYKTLGMDNHVIARKLGVTRQYVGQVLAQKQTKPSPLAQIIFHTQKIHYIHKNNKREVLAELLGFPVDDWQETKVDEELSRIMGD